MAVQGFAPRTGEPVGVPVEATPDSEVDRLCDAAANSARRLAKMSAERRAVLLEWVADALDVQEQRLVTIADSETALGTTRLFGELARTTNQLRLFASVLREGSFVEAALDSPDADAVPPRPELRRMLRALGPVAVFSASNFPFAFSVAGGDTASALASGCPVVVKAHSAHPGTSEATATIVAEALASAGAPEGTFDIVYGQPAGTALVQHPAITAVGFTGSVSGGRTLFDLATSRPSPIPFYGELGSVNPVVVLSGAVDERPEEIATGFARSLTQGVGQFCTNPGLIFVPEGLVGYLRDAVEGTGGGTMLTERMRDAYYSGLSARDQQDGLKLLATGDRMDGAWTVAPTLYQVKLDDFVANAGEFQQECFGPSAIAVTYADDQGLLEVLETLEGSLTGSVHASSSDHSMALSVAEVLGDKVGRLLFNGWPTGVAVSWAMHHGGPYPASTAPLHTSVGATAIRRWMAPISYQSWPDELLPEELRSDNPLGIPRRRDGLLGTQ